MRGLDMVDEAVAARWATLEAAEDAYEASVQQSYIHFQVSSRVSLLPLR